MRVEKSSRLSTRGWMLVRLVAVILGGSVYLWRGSRVERSVHEESAPAESRTREETCSPRHEEDIRRLYPLQSSDLSTSDDIEDFHGALANVVRTDLSHRWDLATEQCPTQELITLLDYRADVPPAAIEQLRHVLVQTDRVTFAGASRSVHR